MLGTSDWLGMQSVGVGVTGANCGGRLQASLRHAKVRIALFEQLPHSSKSHEYMVEFGRS